MYSRHLAASNKLPMCQSRPLTNPDITARSFTTAPETSHRDLQEHMACWLAQRFFTASDYLELSMYMQGTVKLSAIYI